MSLMHGLAKRLESNSSASTDQSRSATLQGPRKLFLLLAFTVLRAAVASDTTVYQNPVLYADYSDPDVIHVGRDFYMIASSFHFVPAIPILHSRDLVHWELAGHVLQRINLAPEYDMKGGTRYGGGVWAPSVRAHNGLFYIYFPTPDEGIFVTTAARMTGPWSKPAAVLAGPGWEDPCPFWDDDGRAYLVHSRLHAGPLILHRMSPDGKKLLDPGKIIVQDPIHLPTLEGPKLYKRHGWYYIFAPIGGVGRGSQVVLRSRNIYGPYDYRIVLAQGSTDVNGPHQGAWVETPDGSSWFIHFSLRGAHGRIVYLEPVRWENDWPVIGHASAGSPTGQPVGDYTLPLLSPGADAMDPQTSDDFNAETLAPNWEWNHNPDNSRWSLTERRGYLRLHATFSPDLLHARNTLTENMQDKSLEFTTEMDVQHLANGGRAGISVFEKSASYIGVTRSGAVQSLVFGLNGTETVGPSFYGKSLLLRARVINDSATYFYSLDGKSFRRLGPQIQLVFSWWKAARPALFCFSTSSNAKNAGFADFNWVRYRALQ
jgi:beta-xylosidase